MNFRLPPQLNFQLQITSLYFMEMYHRTGVHGLGVCVCVTCVISVKDNN